MNPFVWIEIYVTDMPRAVAFYEAVFGFTLETLDAPDGVPVEMMAFPSTMKEPGASGALCKMEGVSPGGGGTLAYFACEDCAVEAGRVADAGGTVEREKTSLGAFGFMALAVDPEGNRIGLHSMA